jgi:hypothetical protein
MEGQFLQASPVAFKDLQFLLAIFKNSSRNVRKKPFRQSQTSSSVAYAISFDHPKLGEMPSSLGFFRAKRRTKQ